MPHLTEILKPIERTRLRYLSKNIKPIANVGKGTRALAHELGVSRTTLSAALNAKPIRVATAERLREYIRQHYAPPSWEWSYEVIKHLAMSSGVHDEQSADAIGEGNK